MEKYYVLYNPIAGCGKGMESAQQIKDLLADKTVELIDLTKVCYAEFLPTLKEEDKLVLSGGDGTLNRFINETDGIEIACPVCHYASGNGNDFAREVAGDEKIVDITKYLKNLPTVTVKGKSYKFLNGVGFGIDGYCCEVGDALRAQGKTNINYAGIAIKGLLFHFKPRNATITIDGVSRRFEKAWLAPTMKGKYYGGGMWPAPSQDRNDPEGLLSLMVFFGSGKLKTLCIFPSIFKGEHVKHTDCVQVFAGKEINVVFDEPCALQIDGETILDVTEYTAVSAAAGVSEKAEENSVTA